MSLNRYLNPKIYALVLGVAVKPITHSAFTTKHLQYFWACWQSPITLMTFIPIKDGVRLKLLQYLALVLEIYERRLFLPNKTPLDNVWLRLCPKIATEFSWSLTFSLWWWNETILSSPEATKQTDVPSRQQVFVDLTQAICLHHHSMVMYVFPAPVARCANARLLSFKRWNVEIRLLIDPVLFWSHRDITTLTFILFVVLMPSCLQVVFIRKTNWRFG